MESQYTIQNKVILLYFVILKTATTLHFLLYELAIHPEIQEEIFLEVSKLNDNLTDEDLSRIPLIKAALKESQR